MYDEDETTPPLVYRAGRRMEMVQANVATKADAFRDAVEKAFHALHQLLRVMPTFADVTATDAIALAERSVVWAVVDQQHRELLTLARQLHELRRSAFWASQLPEQIPTSWTTADSLAFARDPQRWDLTHEQAEAVMAERAEVCQLLERSARIAAIGTADHSTRHLRHESALGDRLVAKGLAVDP
jgi:hypothetical protein